ncbi:WhiB family transcription factor [Mycobacterium phage Validus]|uniref:WhiB family transcription factor n=1 Tax=Mycobacterium phage Validus TaxID=1414747 RepID=V5UQB4_9CAUD|nr:WhiB family transcription factor [Mycobacterium phage Validus]AHB79585.1 WhiB family transcription factor [Mycobacterium phage Validus]
MSAEVFLGRPEAWEADALCAQVDPAIFFPEQGGSVREARRVCARCPVLDECYERAMSFSTDQEGVWAGLTKRERRKIKRGLMDREGRAVA